MKFEQAGRPLPEPAKTGADDALQDVKKLFSEILRERKYQTSVVKSWTKRDLYRRDRKLSKPHLTVLFIVFVHLQLCIIRLFIC